MRTTDTGAPDTSTLAAPLAETFLDRDPSLFDHLDSLIEAETRTEVLETVSDWHPGDIVDLLIRLPFGLTQRVFDWLPVPTAGRALAEIKPAFLATLLGDIPLLPCVAYGRRASTVAARLSDGRRLIRCRCRLIRERVTAGGDIGKPDSCGDGDGG